MDINSFEIKGRTMERWAKKPSNSISKLSFCIRTPTRINRSLPIKGPRLSVNGRRCKTECLPEVTSKKNRKFIDEAKSIMISIRNFKLPDKYPERFQTFSRYKNQSGEWIPLLHRDKVEKILKEIDESIKPILKRFNIFYAALSENHPTRGKAAITFRVPVKFIGKDNEIVKQKAHHIQLRVRNKQFPNDLARLYNRSTLLAVMFHELAHIRHMDHGPDFMLFLRQIYYYARKLSIFPKGEEHQLPSCRSWEKRIFETRGKVTEEELMSLYESS